MFDIETINKLLMDELSAMETYQETLDKLQEDAELEKSLRLIYEDHKEVASTLQAQIRELGGVPSMDSGAWGTLAEVVQLGANLMGKNAALMTLHLGERKGIEHYEKMLPDQELPADIRSLIETKLLPARQLHISILEGLLEIVTTAK
jgi:uncharacterized protein (TIGR02284 family)